MEKVTCLGCRIANQLVDVNVVYEDEHISCVLDIAPFNEGHIIILPKQHFYELEDLTPEVLTAIMQASVKMSRMIKTLFKPDGITICQNGGVFNDLTHFHMHIIPRYTNDGFTWSEPMLDHQAETRLKQTKEAIKNEILAQS